MPSGPKVSYVSSSWVGGAAAAAALAAQDRGPAAWLPAADPRERGVAVAAGSCAQKICGCASSGSETRTISASSPAATAAGRGGGDRKASQLGGGRGGGEGGRRSSPPAQVQPARCCVRDVFSPAPATRAHRSAPVLQSCRHRRRIIGRFALHHGGARAPALGHGRSTGGWGGPGWDCSWWPPPRRRLRSPEGYHSSSQ